MLRTISLPAPAKLNLFLHILGRRADGYHQLQTLFQFLDYADELTFSLRDDGVIQLHDALPGVAHDDNLIVKAANMLKQASGSSLGADIRINKRLPMGGGIGGGSSNAATTLLGLNLIWQCQFDLDQLASLGLQLGADVPVFVRGHAAFAEGVGEQLTPVTLDEPWFVVAVPQVHVSTKEIFCDERLTRNTPAITLAAAQTQEGHNDCLPVVELRYPEVRNALMQLNKFASAKLTGTGACCFTSFPSQQEADKVSRSLEGGLQHFVAKGSNISMLHKALQSLHQ